MDTNKTLLVYIGPMTESRYLEAERLPTKISTMDEPMYNICLLTLRFTSITLFPQKSRRIICLQDNNRDEFKYTTYAPVDLKY